MSTVTVTAISPFNSFKPGDVFELTEREADQAERKGLVKMQGPVSNKMKIQSENKANPSPADGAVAPSSVSPAARVSPRTTARVSGDGVKPKRTYTRRAK